MNQNGSSLGYLEACIAEALVQSGGNLTAARRLLATRVQLDVRLLQALAAPHMAGIIAYHVDRVARRGSDVLQALQPSPKTSQTNKTLPTLPADFAHDLLSAIVSNQGPLFGQGAGEAPPVHRTIASPTHVQALRTIAAAHKRKIQIRHDTL